MGGTWSDGPRNPPGPLGYSSRETPIGLSAGALDVLVVAPVLQHLLPLPAGAGKAGEGERRDFVATNVRYCRYCSIILSIGYHTSIVQYFSLDTAYFSKAAGHFNISLRVSDVGE